ncbi:GntR family transcriptional regulator [Dictyobacter kobayashii]|uniref:GntR family transcriptional regulator n=1 Tax=Dictyobacter kobayashii TaxID=2014872 RepID=A0A402ATE0_9CHLR|nr:GntR family transcriptional regulator [Dictyobacter kobayashii]GCE22352.1 GntR family transcriptional regulator [Dictyobacter kobayashii]
MHKPEKESHAKTMKAMYMQIVSELRARILSGELTHGSRISTEFEIAQQYHVSRGTVRQALSELTREGLLERIQGSGTFVRSAALTHGSDMTISTQKNIGVILNQATDELNMKLLRGIEQSVKSRGYQVIFAYSEENEQLLARDIARLQLTTEGLIIFPLSNKSTDNAIARLKHVGFPFVLVDRYMTELDSDYVVSDNVGGGYRATEHLAILGHTRIGFAYSRAGGRQTTSVRDRWEGYRKALSEYQRPYDDSLLFADLLTGSEPDSARFDEILRRPDRPGAIFAVNDWVALEFIKAAARTGVRIPEDVALVGFDDLSYAELLSVPLTTVAQQGIAMGIQAGTLLINRIEKHVLGAAKHIVLPTQLIVRQSCGARLQVLSSPDEEHN